MDILTVRHGIIVHQVNVQGKMGRGLAKAIADKWPNVRQAYIQACAGHRLQLGDIQLVHVKEGRKYVPDLIVCNLVGQEGFGTDRRYTNYAAISVGLFKLKTYIQAVKLPVYFPKGMGCGFGGGDWGLVEPMIVEQFPDAIICDFYE